MYARAIEEMLKDGNIPVEPSRWTVFVDKLHKEQGQIMLIATVLLTANLAHMTIPGVDQLGIVQAFGQASIIASLVSIASGFFLMRICWINAQAQPLFDSPPRRWCFTCICSLPVAALSHGFTYFCYGIIFRIDKGRHSGAIVIVTVGIPTIVFIVVFWAISAFIFGDTPWVQVSRFPPGGD